MTMPAVARILIVDDEALNLDVLGRLMVRLGYHVRTAINGAAALAAASEERPDVVLLDINMPGIDGVEVCRRLKANPETRLIPVVLISALSETYDRIRGKEAGADDFLAKPPDFGSSKRASVRSCGSNASPTN